MRASIGAARRTPEPPRRIALWSCDHVFEPLPDGATVEKLGHYDTVVAELLSVLDRAAAVELAGMLAARLGYYERRYGKIRLEETFMSVHADVPTPEQIADRVHGMQTLIALLMSASGN